MFPPLGACFTCLKLEICCFLQKTTVRNVIIWTITIKISRAGIIAEAEYEDSYGNSTCPKTRKKRSLRHEGAEAVPVESEVFCRSE
ncbi:hypothetical protein D8M05_06750 [Oceanobacillus bengalensis]|uniref:Uncharacterized protein n=1 Tax=Oceanobacillus bengalensis TaxID=1435466 RepID=A0A494Z2E5_9BACI|nr:hypothetical protein D8M05_06750 [Oceanobacillus bengalensis]